MTWIPKWQQQATVTLTDDEVEVCRMLGAARHQAARAAGVKDRKMGPQDAIEGDINGIGGEMAFCKACEVPLDDTVGARKGGHDALVVGIRFDVKTTARANGMLLAMRSKTLADADAYALVRGELPTYTIAGWCWSDELLDDANLVNKGWGLGYGLEAISLRRFAELRKIIDVAAWQARRNIK